MSNPVLSPVEIRRKLLDAAKELFLSNGIDNTEMKMIAARSGLSRSTLYRYCTDKDQLIFTVSTEMMAEFGQKRRSLSYKPGATGYEKLCAYTGHMVDLLEENPAFIRFYSEFDRIFTGDYPDIPEAKDYAALAASGLNTDIRLIFEGIADGSIRPMEHPSLFMSVLINTALGLAARLLPRDSHYRTEQHVSGREILDETLRILLESIKA